MSDPNIIPVLDVVTHGGTSSPHHGELRTADNADIHSGNRNCDDRDEQLKKVVDDTMHDDDNEENVVGNEHENNTEMGEGAGEIRTEDVNAPNVDCDTLDDSDVIHRLRHGDGSDGQTSVRRSTRSASKKRVADYCD